MQDVPKIVRARLQRAGPLAAESHPDSDLLTAFAEQALTGRELFSDGSADEDWLRKLFDAAGEEPSFTIRRTLANTVILRGAAARDLSDTSIIKAAQETSRTFPHTHRAEPDARHLAALWGILSVVASRSCAT